MEQDECLECLLARSVRPLQYGVAEEFGRAIGVHLQEYAALVAERDALKEELRKSLDLLIRRTADGDAYLAWGDRLRVECRKAAVSVREVSFSASISVKDSDHLERIEKALRKIESTAPPATLEAFRQRERRLGAAEELERLANDECATVFPSDLPHVTQNDLMDRAAELRKDAERA